MKKIFTLLLTLIASVGCLYAQTGEYEWYISAKTETYTPKDNNIISQDASGKHNLNAGYPGTFTNFAGTKITCNSGLKMEGTTKMILEPTQTCEVTIAQSIAKNTANTIKFDDAELDITTGVESGNVRIYTITDVAKGTHSVSRGNAESGIVYIGVKYTGAILTNLDAPVISYDAATGEVTLTANNAEKIVYTTDGSKPTDNSTEYTAPFTVSDGVVVWAMAVGDNVSTANSFAVSKQVLLTSGNIAEITCDQFNGAFHLLCETPNVKIEYKVGVDPDWKTYTLPITLFDEGTTKVQARATRDGWTTSTASFDIVVPPYVKGHDEIIIGFGSFTEGSASETLTGVIGDPTKAMGITLSMSGSDFSYGNIDLTLNGYGTETRKSIKGSNGKEITMTIPKGMTVMRVAFFNYLNGEPSTDAYWAVKYGETGTDEDWVTSEIVPDESHDKTDPAARVFKFVDGVKDQLVFKHVGIQPVFCMVVYVVYDDLDITHDLDETEGLWVEDYEYSFTLMPAQPHHEIWAKFEPFKASRSVDASTLGTEFTKLETINDEGHVEVVVPAKTPGTFSYYSVDPTTKKQSDVRTLTFDDSTGIEDVLVDGVDQAAEYYNLQGQRVLNPVKGNLYIVKKAGKATKVVL